MKTTIAQEMIREAWLEGFVKGWLGGWEIGLAKGIRSSLVRIGQKSLGPPNEAFWVELNSVADTDRLYRMVDRLADGGSWGDLLTVK